MITGFECLTEAELGRARAILRDLPPSAWTDGKETAGDRIRDRKRNRQLQAPPKELVQLVGTALYRSPVFLGLAWPESMSILVSRYGPGDGYDFHVDAAVQGPFERRDVALSIGLEEPERGGTMQFRLGSVTSEVALRAGTAIMFEPQIEHRVTPVERGERVVALVWVKSRIPDRTEREILYRLQEAENGLINEVGGNTVLDTLNVARQNLIRKWLR